MNAFLTSICARQERGIHDVSKILRFKHSRARTHGITSIMDSRLSVSELDTELRARSGESGDGILSHWEGHSVEPTNFREPQDFQRRARAANSPLVPASGALLVVEDDDNPSIDSSSGGRPLSSDIPATISRDDEGFTLSSHAAKESKAISTDMDS